MSAKSKKAREERRVQASRSTSTTFAEAASPRVVRDVDEPVVMMVGVLREHGAYRVLNARVPLSVLLKHDVQYTEPDFLPFAITRITNLIEEEARKSQ